MLEKIIQPLNSILPSEVLETEFWANSLGDYLGAAVVLVVLLLLFKIFQSIILHRLKKLALKTKTDIDDAFIEIVQSVRPPFYFFLAFYLAIKTLTISGWGQKVINVILIVWLVYQVIVAIQILINYVARKGLAKTGERESKMAISAISLLTKIVLWSFGLLLILSNLGVDVTSLIAGLGIGGIAIALAIQNILGDLFSSLSIYIDKPFQVGDFIVLGNDKGTVEKIGLKSTRIRTLQGEELVVSNKELTTVRVQNFKKMQKRRVVAQLGVIYGTKSEKLKKIPEIIKKIIDDEKLTDFDRCHFASYGDSSLNFEYVYYVNSSEYNDYMDINQRINLAIYEQFNQDKIEFAYPTQTVFLEK